MHGLETIVKQNQTRFEKAIDNYRSQGCWVLAKYDGLHLVSIEAFGSAFDETVSDMATPPRTT